MGGTSISIGENSIMIPINDARAGQSCLCEERSDEAIHLLLRGKMDCFAPLAMTGPFQEKSSAAAFAAAEQCIRPASIRESRQPAGVKTTRTQSRHPEVRALARLEG
jgi:hypothetical protein